MTNIAVATSSQLAADAAHEIAAAGGNAVDCALAASLVTMNTQPGVCALAGSAFITLWRAGEEPITIDGNVAVPGAGLAEQERRQGTLSVAMEYGGGIETLIGSGSVAIPGSLAAFELASRQYGKTDWRSIFAPAIRATRDGFPLPAACHYYLEYSGDVIFARSKEGHAALHDANGRLHASGTPIVVPGLSDTLDAISREGADLFYKGELATRIADHCRNGGGMLTLEDLITYRALERTPLRTSLGGWSIATNPPPAVGGAILIAMLISCSDIEGSFWSQDALRKLMRSQQVCLDYRKRHLDLADDIDAAVTELLQSAHNGQLLNRWSSASTVHTSVVDDEGNACAITASSGYGAGEIPQGTGLWLNNSLGEIELNRRGLDAGPVGARLPSNMAPTVARHDQSVLAVGSPGADRITTALQQFLINYLQLDMSLPDAIAHPRMHVDTSGPEVRLMAEAGLNLPDSDLPLTEFPQRVMYFGGVGAALHDAKSGLSSAADPRREGGT